MDEFVWIAIDVFKKCLLNSIEHVQETVVLCPFGEKERELEGGKDELAEIISHVFNSEWSRKKGPFYGAKVKVLIISESTFEDKSE